jgi:transcriptional regulator with XRE-family HTH domain
MTIGERVKELRLALKLTQRELAIRAGLSHIQLGRYETHKSKPSSEMLQKLATALNTTTDFLVQGDQNDVVVAQLSDKELLEQFRQVQMLGEEDKRVVKVLLDAFLLKRKLQGMV